MVHIVVNNVARGLESHKEKVMNDKKRSIAAQRLRESKLKDSAERGEEEGRERLLCSGEPPEGQWFRDARDLMADSSDAWQLRWDDLVWRNAPEVAAEFTRVIEMEDLDAATFWGVWTIHSELTA